MSLVPSYAYVGANSPNYDQFTSSFSKYSWLISIGKKANISLLISTKYNNCYNNGQIVGSSFKGKCVLWDKKMTCNKRKY